MLPLALWTLLACFRAQAPLTLEEGVVRLDAQLAEAAFLHGNGHMDDAMETWEEANRTLNDTVLPALRDHSDPRAVVEIEVQMGHIHRELERRRGVPETWIVPMMSAIEAAKPPATPAP